MELTAGWKYSCNDDVRQARKEESFRACCAFREGESGPGLRPGHGPTAGPDGA